MPPKAFSADSAKGSKVVYVQGFPPRADALFVFKTYFDSDDLHHTVVEIHTATRNITGVAWIELDSVDSATDVVKRLDGQSHVDIRDRTSRMLTASLSKRAPPPKGLARLSDWRKEREDMVASRTVEISNLSTEDPRSSLDRLMKLVEARNDEAEDPEHTFDIEHLEITAPGTALVQFAAEYTAELAVDAFSGMYWQEATVYIKFVPDSTIDQFFATVIKEKTASKKASDQLAAANAYLQAMDQMEAPSDAGSPPDVDELSGRISSLEIEMESVDVRIDNLAYAATKEDVRKAFARKDLEVTKVVLKKGFAWVGLPSQYDAERAVKVMTGRRIKGRALEVEMAKKE
ncbi:hypothetical protein BDV96DRAFT_360325 [Lophiotrema nucula]|uniref:RRM domain-containing protein n=1 Tax=Lophiotrema nucula TaxID=690887 RepID=A0A6A5ZGJ4_9PLEO|nr:hypothetical protein BDV96DRAFT_360325 [Lophiotrema nucula]